MDSTSNPALFDSRLLFCIWSFSLITYLLTSRLYICNLYMRFINKIFLLFLNSSHSNHTLPLLRHLKLLLPIFIFKLHLYSPFTFIFISTISRLSTHPNTRTTYDLKHFSYKFVGASLTIIHLPRPIILSLVTRVNFLLTVLPNETGACCQNFRYQLSIESFFLLATQICLPLLHCYCLCMRIYAPVTGARRGSKTWNGTLFK